MAIKYVSVLIFEGQTKILYRWGNHNLDTLGSWKEKFKFCCK